MSHLPGVLELLLKAIREGNKNKIGRYEIAIEGSETVKTDFYRELGEADSDTKELVCMTMGIKNIEVAA